MFSYIVRKTRVPKTAKAPVSFIQYDLGQIWAYIVVYCKLYCFLKWNDSTVVNKSLSYVYVAIRWEKKQVSNTGTADRATSFCAAVSHIPSHAP